MQSLFRALILVIIWVLSVSAKADTAPDDSGVAPELATAESLTLWYFRRDDCPFCERAERWLPQLLDTYPGLQLQRIDLGDGASARAQFEQMMRERGQVARAVPTFIIEDNIWVGHSAALEAQIEAWVATRLGAVSPAVIARDGRQLLPDLASLPMFAATVMIAFVDGFNPCSLWVLTVLLAMIIGSGSRRRVAVVGLTFLLVTASIYGLFIAGLFTALTLLEHLFWVQWLVAAFALVFALVNLKDYFAWQKGFSFSIPERFKPAIYRRGRAVRTGDSLPMTLLLTVVMAAGVAIVELPCTAGLPVVWSTLMVEAEVEGIGFFLLLLLYLLVYLLIESVILVLALVTLHIGKLQQKQGRQLKLIGGCIMLVLAFVLIFDPAIMESLSGVLLVLLASTLLAAIIVGLRLVLAARYTSS